MAPYCESAGKESASSAEDLGLIPGLGRSPGEGKGYPLQYSGLENSMDCIVHGVAKGRTTVLFQSCHTPQQLCVGARLFSVPCCFWPRRLYPLFLSFFPRSSRGVSTSSSFPWIRRNEEHKNSFGKPPEKF